MNSITPVRRLSTTANTVHLLKFKKKAQSTESCSWVNLSYFQMQDSIHHGMNATLFHVSKINKTLKILLLKFLGYFTTKTETKKFKKLLGKNQVPAYTESLHHSCKDLASTEVIKPIPLCCSFPRRIVPWTPMLLGNWKSAQWKLQ